MFIARAKDKFSSEEFIGPAQSTRKMAKSVLENLLWNAGWSLMQFDVRTQEIYRYLEECDASGCAA